MRKISSTYCVSWTVDVWSGLSVGGVVAMLLARSHVEWLMVIVSPPDLRIGTVRGLSVTHILRRWVISLLPLSSRRDKGACRGNAIGTKVEQGCVSIRYIWTKDVCRDLSNGRKN